MKITTYPQSGAVSWLLLLSLAIPLLMQPTTSHAQAAKGNCHQLEWRRGRPYDYYAEETRVSTGTYRGGLKYLVEHGHFNQNVQSLRRGQTALLPGDLLFILTTIPNHPGALDTYSTFEQRYKMLKSFRESKYTQAPTYETECFFERATQIYPQQGETYMVWGIHRHRVKDYEGAISKYREALSRGYNSPELHYNLGLSYLEHGNWGEADRHEKQAAAAGYPLKGLRNRLERIAQQGSDGNNVND